MSRTDMSPKGVSERIRQVSEQADLSPARRLDSKIDLSAAGVSKRLREVSELTELCRRLGSRRS